MGFWERDRGDMTEVHKNHENSGKTECKSAIKLQNNRIKSLTATVDTVKVQKKPASLLCC